MPTYTPHPRVQKMIEDAAKRRATMQALRDKGWTLQRIADKYEIGRERVRQILNGRKPSNGS